MQYLAFAASFFVSAAAISLLIYCRRERQKELYRMETLRASRLYKDLYPLIQKASSRDLDQVRIERDRVTIMIGGAPTSEEYCRAIGADLYTPDAATAARKAAEILQKRPA